MKISASSLPPRTRKKTPIYRNMWIYPIAIVVLAISYRLKQAHDKLLLQRERHSLNEFMQIEKLLNRRHKRKRSCGSISYDPNYYPDEGSDDKFKDLYDNKVQKTREAPVSTFSADTDSASYCFARKVLKDGFLPSQESIRAEQFINYFDYDYPKPEDKETPFTASVAINESPWHGRKKLLYIGIKGFDVDSSNPPPANIVFLVDVFRSTHRSLDLIKKSMKMLVQSLRPTDHVSIVSHSSTNRFPLRSTAATKQSTIISAINSLSTRVGKRVVEAFKEAYQLAEENFDKEAVNRIILLTDGDFYDELLDEYIQRKRQSGIFLSILNFGFVIDSDTTMETLADYGNGVAAYINSLEEAHKVMVTEASSAKFPIANDLEIQVEFNPATVSEYRLIGYEKRLPTSEDVNSGEIGSGHTVTAIYEITPVGSTKMDEFKYSTLDSLWNNEYAFLNICCKLPGEEESKLVVSKFISQKDNFDALKNKQLLREFQFATAVATFAQNLQLEGKETILPYESILELAESSVERGDGEFCYRTEFLNMVRSANKINELDYDKYVSSSF